MFEKFDKNCPATDTFKAFFYITCPQLARNLSEKQIIEVTSTLNKNSRYFNGYGMSR